MICRIPRRASLLLALSLLALPAAAQAKPESLAALAQALAAKLPRQPGLVVYVASPEWLATGSHSALRQKIGAELAAALAAADPTARVQTPDETLAALRQAGFQPFDSLLLAGLAPAFLPAKPGAAAVGIVGDLQEEGDRLALTVSAVRVGENKPFAKLAARLPESPEWRALLALPEKPLESPDGVYLAHYGGVGAPRCLECPAPRFSPGAIASRTGGSVMLAITVAADGTVHHVTVLRGVPGSGLDRSAARAVRAWRFRPAVGLEGKPVPVRMAVEVDFRMMPGRRF